MFYFNLNPLSKPIHLNTRRFVTEYDDIKVYTLKSDPLSKNTVSAFQISCKLLSFTLKDS